MEDWLQALTERRNAGQACVLVTVLAVRGSLPRRPGAKMLVDDSAVAGSIGGSRIEHRALIFARELLRDGAEVPVRREFSGEGRDPAGLELLFEPLPADDFSVWLFGAGHVGRALATILQLLPCRLCWLDSRAGLFPESLPARISARVVEAPERELSAAPAGSLLVLCSHSHEQDFRVAEAALTRDRWRYLGMIGSASKRAQFEQRLVERRPELLAAATARLCCPIGIPGVEGRSPGEIAVAVAAQLLQTRASPAALSDG